MVQTKQNLIQLFENATRNDIEGLDFIIDLVNIYRKQRNAVLVDIQDLLDLLQTNAEYRNILLEKIESLSISKKDFDQIISDVGIINYSDFLYELRLRLVARFIPHQAPLDSLEFILNQIFYDRKDSEWIATIPGEQLISLFELLESKNIYADNVDKHAVSEILYGLEVLTQRVSGRAMEADVSKMTPEYRNFDNPFIGLLQEMTNIIQYVRSQKRPHLESSDIYYKQINILLNQCDKYIDDAFANSHKLGISMKVNQSLLRLRQQLGRIREILNYLVLDDPNKGVEQTISLIKKLIYINVNKTNVRRLVNESTQSIAYEITQHTAQTGEHYITSSKKEYTNMFWSACGGGCIVAFLCIIKVLMSKADTSIFGHAVLYSLNYALGFTAIYLLGCTLATKQPAMTASALVSALQRKTGNKEERNYKYWSFANFFSRVFRSQFIAFVGNVLLAFPIAMLLIWGIDTLFSYNIASSKWRGLLTDLDPVDSPAIYHAAIAGVFLFLSGIIAGSVANRDKYNSLYFRIEQHPIIKKVFGKEKTKKFAEWYKKKWAGVISNIWFGVFMGMTGSIGIFLGLDIDIRHITFASGNLALGMYGSDWRAPTDMIIWGIVGIGVIGFVNFIVSFTLSLILAFRARKMKLYELVLVSKAIWALFLLSPMQFFFPPKEKKQE
ncbi:site-specific recombinase [Sphingobacterium composti Ten et al. 2007 non Yoo et al. 2007]|uniref:site-specific recombinase n=1 Tax=Sphingobacterium composti TaxID=363260 RepID=UPI001F44D92E|nr:site-specific recombinase [Sphingobacterium composti Ten et al. 2007 non Yoo et al. 2007]